MFLSMRVEAFLLVVLCCIHMSYGGRRVIVFLTSIILVFFASSTVAQIPTAMDSIAGYLERVINPYGYSLERVTGAENTPVIDSDGVPLWKKWQAISRNRYVTDSSWNETEQYLIVTSADRNGTNSFKALLDGETHKVIRLLGAVSQNYRWSMNPATPDRLYAIPADADYLLKYEIVRTVSTTGENETRISLPFHLAKDPQTKVNFAFVNGIEYIALLGSALPGSDAGTYIHVVRVANGETASVVASYRADEAACGHPIETKCKEPNPNAFYFSPDGRHVFLGYNLDKIPRGNGWRLFDVDLSGGAIHYHAVPQIASGSRKNSTNGFFNVNWGHPVFVAARGTSDSYIVGTIYDFWDSQVVPEIRTVNSRYKTGKLIKFDIANNTFYSLTDPEGPLGKTAEATFLHVSGANYQSPGYVAVSYDAKPRTANTSKFKGRIILVNVDAPLGPNGTIEIAAHDSNIGNCYDCEIFPNISPSGRQLIYSTNGGNLENPIVSYIVRLPNIVRSPASARPEDFRAYQPPLLRSDLKVASVSQAASSTSTVRFTVKVKNAGPDKSFKSMVKVRFPTDSRVGVISVSNNCVIVPGGADCSLFTIRPNAAKALSVTVRAISCPQIPYSFAIDLVNDGTDTNMTNNHRGYSPRGSVRCP